MPVSHDAADTYPQHEKNIPADEESLAMDEKKVETPPYMQDAFGDEEFAEVKYKVLKWWYVSCLSTVTNACLMESTGNAVCSW
jgi:hypothetical protein